VRPPHQRLDDADLIDAKRHRPVVPNRAHWQPVQFCVIPHLRAV
jgi:hypothetical protein